MTVHNTPSDAANTAVRAYLTRLGEKYLGRGFNTGSGSGKQTWEEIKASFGHRCAYCGGDSKLTVEHLVSLNRTQGGLHHPGNLVPCCTGCNRRKKKSGQEVDWRAHLAYIIDKNRGPVSVLRKRQRRIEHHIGKLKYPDLSDDESAAITTIAKSLYDAVSEETKRGANLYWSIHEAMINKPS